MSTKKYVRVAARPEVRGTPWSDSELALLGLGSDGEAARRTGRSSSAVAAKRQALGIAPAHAHWRTWTKKELRMLGKKSDAFVARSIGASRGHVLKKRTALGIPAFSERNRPKWLDGQ
mgnify:CR=1 FL=1